MVTSEEVRLELPIVDIRRRSNMRKRSSGYRGAVSDTVRVHGFWWGPGRARAGRLAVLVSVFMTLAVICRAGTQQVSKDIDDKDITTALSSEIRLDHVIDANTIDVEIQDGIVTLKGTVGSILEKERSVQIAESLVGVRAIVDRLRVNPRESRSDGEIEIDVESALTVDPAVEVSEVDAVVRRGTVTLTGSVDSWQEKELCAIVVKGVKGVREVRNHISVSYKSERPDHEIREEIEARLANDVLVDDGLIAVRVKDGKVTLNGTVGSLAEKVRARMDAWVGGVDSVEADGLAIEWWARDDMRRKSLSDSRDDSEIRKAVRDAFLYDPRVISFNPTVEVENGTVTLSGIVNNLAAREAAEQDARNVVGVWRVRNHLKVRPKAAPNEELETRIINAFRRDPFIDRWGHRCRRLLRLRLSLRKSRERLREDSGPRGSRSASRSVSDVINALVQIDRDVWTWKSDRAIRDDVREQLFWSPYVD